MKKIIIMLTILILILTGCSFHLNFKTKMDEESIEYNDETKANDIIEVQQENEVFKDLKMLGKEIVNANDEIIIKQILKKYKERSFLNIDYIYYSSVDGDFMIIPEVDMPEGYDFHERPPYIEAIEEGIYIPQPYEDVMSKKKIQSIAIKIKKNNEIEGVLGIDYILDEN